MHFPTKSHLLSASEDGTMCIFHTRDWAVLATLRGHKGRVNSAAVHPSSKVCLSVGKDRTLRMWDMMRGKGSASVKLGKGLLCFVCVIQPIDHIQRGRTGPLDYFGDPFRCRHWFNN